MTKFDATEKLANFSFSDDSIYNWRTNDLFGWRGEGGGVKGSRVVLAKNKLILC